jgi:small subunit ribosomal protein S6
MPKEAAYDLLVLLDAEAPEERRNQLIQQIQSQIEAGAGTLKSDADWGVRKLAFEIGHRTEAHYHLFQLEARPELLGQLRHMLAIEDGVIRHRIIRLTKGAPEKAPSLSPQAPRQPEPVRDDPSPEQAGDPEPAAEQTSAD